VSATRSTCTRTSHADGKSMPWDSLLRKGKMAKVNIRSARLSLISSESGGLSRYGG
jgi:hypothetical protein